MTRDDIIRVAQSVGLGNAINIPGIEEFLERFFHVAQAAEREACAQMVEDLNEIGHSYGLENRIRARGQV